METLPSFEENMDVFRGEIKELMGKEPGHFRGENFEIEALTGSDGAMWQEIKNQTLTKEELKEYEQEVRSSGIPSRMTFLGVVNNKAMGLFLRREREARTQGQ